MATSDNLSKPSNRWRRKADVYRRFAAVAERTGFVCDFSESAARAMFTRESTGRGDVSPDNGYAIGKSWLDVQLAMWREDIPLGLVSMDEIPDELRPLLGEVAERGMQPASATRD